MLSRIILVLLIVNIIVNLMNIMNIVKVQNEEEYDSKSVKCQQGGDSQILNGQCACPSGWQVVYKSDGCR